jgi:predicted glycogen debranching enzyme
MNEVPQRVLKLSNLDGQANITDLLLSREWLVTNGLSGYASGTIGDVNTWRYHGILVSAEAEPLGRIMVVKNLSEQLRFSYHKAVSITGEETEPGVIDVPGAGQLHEFRLEYGLPIWRYKVEGVEIERIIFMLHRQNTVYVNYRILSAPKAVQLELRPFVSFSPQQQSDYNPQTLPFALHMQNDRYEVSAGEELPRLRMSLRYERTYFVTEGGMNRDTFFRRDAERGYEARHVSWTPGFFQTPITPGQEITLILSTESWANIEAMKPSEALAFERQRRSGLIEHAESSVQSGIAAELVLAADQFIFEPRGRLRDKVQAHAMDDKVRAVIAGYHWFTDWGRDTMISLEGLTLTTGRYSDARGILRTFNRYIRDGLIPNFIPEGADKGVYHTADATLWYFHALDRYLAYTDDRVTLRFLLPSLINIIEHHISGTRFGIHVDTSDGLLTQGEEGYQLTWMDAKVDGWVVTPRRGKAVEINGLFYNALCLLAEWLEADGEAGMAKKYKEHAEKLRKSFNDRFWFEGGNYLYDVIDGENGDDSACRPNQLISFSLKYPVLDKKYWQPVIEIVQQKLLTPVGLRSLSPDHPDYKSKYFGDLRARDAAYHQGTVWPWLIGPFVDAYLALNPDSKETIRKSLEGFIPHLNEACIGSISEICDATKPFIPRGCISQAWSVAEVLRCWAKTSCLPKQ